MHFAAFAYVGESVTCPGLYYRNNFVGTLSLLDAMREAGVDNRFLLDLRDVRGSRRMPIRETTATAPLNPYGETKLAIERVLHWYGAAYGLRWLPLRYFNAAGTDPDGEIGENHEPETHLIPLIRALRSAAARRIQIFGTDYPTRDGTAIRDYVHVTDWRRACQGIGASRGRGREHGAQSRNRQRPFGARGHRGGGTRRR